MIYANSSIDTTSSYIFSKLSPVDRIYMKYNPLITDNNVLRYVRIKNDAFITLHDYYDDAYRDNHPFKGLVVNIAAIDSSRGNGDTDYLLKNAISDMRSMTDSHSDCIIAEIDPSNDHALNLFERNGFTPIGSDDKIYYICYTRS